MNKDARYNAALPSSTSAQHSNSAPGQHRSLLKQKQERSVLRDERSRASSTWGSLAIRG
ncbi:hypothetical protein WI664_10335 [Vibrio cholerae]